MGKSYEAYKGIRYSATFRTLPLFQSLSQQFIHSGLKGVEMLKRCVNPATIFKLKFYIFFILNMNSELPYRKHPVTWYHLVGEIPFTFKRGLNKRNSQ